MPRQNLHEIEEKLLFEGYYGKIIHGDKITVAHVRVKANSPLPEHSHPHEQIMNLIEGEFIFIVDGVEHLMKAGLIRGASLDNAMVIRDGAIISKDGQRFKNELVRHKTLDVIGDLSLIGRRLRGKLIAIKPGHPLNVAMAQKIFELINANE